MNYLDDIKKRHADSRNGLSAVGMGIVLVIFGLMVVGVIVGVVLAIV
jgi:hypothetical protein